MGETTVESLKRTPKGQLNYSKPWDSCSATEKQKILNNISSPPLISPEVTHHRIRLPSPSPPPSPPPLFSTPLPPSSPPPSPPPPPLSPSPPLSLHPSPSPPPGDVKSLTTDSSTGNLEVQSPIKQIQDECDEYWQSLDDLIMLEVETNMAERRLHFVACKERITSHYDNKRITLKLERSMEQLIIREKQREEEERHLKEEIESQMKRNNLTYSYHQEFVSQHVRSYEEKKDHQLKELEEKRKEKIKILKTQFNQTKQDAITIINQLNISLQSCLYSHLMSPEIIAAIEQTSTILIHIMITVETEEQAIKPDKNKLEALQKLLSHGQQTLVNVKLEVERVNQKGKEEEEKLKIAQLEEQKRLIKEKEEREKKSQATGNEQKGTALGTSPKASDKGEEVKAGNTATVVISSGGLHQYTKIQDKLNQAITSSNNLSKSTDSRIKKYRFNLQKAVNTPVCAISSQSGGHLFDKIKRLRQLLSGGEVEVVGGKVSVNQHPEAKIYCINLLAKKLVKQGEEQVSSRMIAAFPIAGVIVHLSSDYPELMDLFIAHCHASCPILVPMYFKRQQGMSEPDHLKLQGYKVSEEGVIEKEDLYLKRMSGIVRLYAAVLQTVNPYPHKSHPHGVENGWTWFARILNTEPETSITATAILDMLEVCGYSLMRRYGKQFQKLLLILCQKYIPKIDRITPQSNRGPYSRLKVFLDECIHKGRIPVPEGILSDQFWRTQTKTSIISD